MKKMHLLAGLLGVALACAIVAAQDATTRDSTGGDDKAAAKAAGRNRLTRPWNTIASLSDDQKEKIMAIHSKANDDVRAVRDKEESDIMTVLTDEQKAELKAMQDKAKSETKAKRADKKPGGAGDPGDEPKDK